MTGAVTCVRFGALVAFASAVTLAGCARLEKVSAAGDTGFEELYERNLAGFEQQIALREYAGDSGPWLKVGRAWLSYANCEPINETSIDTSKGAEAKVANFVLASLEVADARRRARRVEQLRNRSGWSWAGGEWLDDSMQSDDFFRRQPDEPDASEIRWPAEPERWPDEKPASIAVEDKCDTFEDAADVATHRRRVLRAIEGVAEAWDMLPEDARDGSIAATHRRVRWYGATVAFRYAMDDRLHRTEEVSKNNQSTRPKVDLRAASLEERARRYLQPLVNIQKPGAEMTEKRLARALLMRAVLEFRKSGDRQAADEASAIGWLERAGKLGLEGGNRWRGRYLRLRVLSRRGEWKAAAKLAEKRPPEGSRLYSAYAYRAAVALQQVDRDDAFLGLVKEVFRHHRPEEDAFLEALSRRTMRHLAAYPFDERIVEVLEELGPRDGLYNRVEQYARAAIGRGNAQAAERAAEWLLNHHRDARARPRYRAVLALVAFQRDRPDQFRQHIDDIARRPESLLEVIPPGRRASFFAPADSALARILRLTLPMMAEWGESPAAEQRRERWLTIIVEEIQQFLRTTDESVARPALEEMYRIASEQLAEDPRGYAARVGSDDPATLVLGTVEVGPGDLSEAEPLIDVAVSMPYSVTLIPRSEIPVKAWPHRWPSDEREPAGGSNES